MKTQLLLSRVMLITIIFTLSCQQEEGYFSCDPEVEKVILQELPDIQVMTRSDWLKIEIGEYKTAVFRAFTPKQRHVFISEKLLEVTQLTWSKKEMNHILKLQAFINNNPEFLETNWGADKELVDQFDLFQYKWLEDARQLGWTEKQIYAIAFSPDIIINKDGDLLEPIEYIKTPTNTNNIKTRSESGDGDLATCFCHPYFNYCQAGDPAMWFMSCETGNCKERWPGCQLLLLGTCTGFCKFIFQ